MLFDEEWYERQMEKLKDEYREEGITIGLEKGISQTKIDVTKAMILEGCEDELILKVTKVTPDFLASAKENLTGSKQTEN